MKNIIHLFFMFLSIYGSAQKYTAEQVEQTNDAKIVANFIKHNPNHPKTPEFRGKLYALINGDKSSVAKTTTKNTHKNEPVKSTARTSPPNSKVSEEHQKTADILTHLFDNNPNKREAYILIKNLSPCNLMVKISGKKLYHLAIPPKNQNYILVNKGKYTLSASICEVKYSSVKDIQKDIEITLNSGKH